MSSEPNSVRSRHHGQNPAGVEAIAINPYRIKGGISAVIAIAKAAGVSYCAGYTGGAMFISYPQSAEDVAIVDELIEEAYRLNDD